MGESTMFILDPTGKPKAIGLQLSSRPADIRGMTVGILDNGWWSFETVGKHYAKLLKERYGVKDVIHLKKKLSTPAPKETFEELATKCQVIINGLGN